MLTRRRSSFLLVSVLVALAGCGGGQAPGAPPAGVTAPPAGATAPPAGATVAPPAQGGLDACNILTTAEIQAVIGSAVTAESGGDPVDGQTICTFSTADGEDVLYTAYDPDGAIGFEAWKGTGETQTVPALGDEAIFNPQIGLLVRRAQATFQFYPLGGVGPEEALDLALELARAASSRF